MTITLLHYHRPPNSPILYWSIYCTDFYLKFEIQYKNIILNSRGFVCHGTCVTIARTCNYRGSEPDLTAHKWRIHSCRIFYQRYYTSMRDRTEILYDFIGPLCRIIIMLWDSISVLPVHYFIVFTVLNCTTAVLLIRFETIARDEWRTNELYEKTLVRYDCKYVWLNILWTESVICRL